MTTSAETPPNQAVVDPDAMSHRQILEALTGLLAALFTALLSTTIVSTALPTIIGDLKGSQTAYAWVITTALLANAASTPIWGKLADLFNKKVLVQSAIVIFVAGSLIAGFAHNVPVLLAARVVQGIGMGGLTALVIAIIGTIVSPRDRGRYSGYTGAVMAVSMSGGPILGGVIVDSPLGWRWCFFVCVPLAVIALGLLQKTLHIKTVRKDNVSIDWLGALLLTAGVSVLLVWVSFAGKADYYAWISRETAYLVGGGVLLLILTIIVEARHKSPIIPLKIVTERTTGLAIIASIAVASASSEPPPSSASTSRPLAATPPPKPDCSPSHWCSACSSPPSARVSSSPSSESGSRSSSPALFCWSSDSCSWAPSITPPAWSRSASSSPSSASVPAC